MNEEFIFFFHLWLSKRLVLSAAAWVVSSSSFLTLSLCYCRLAIVPHDIVAITTSGTCFYHTDRAFAKSCSNPQKGNHSVCAIRRTIQRLFLLRISSNSFWDNPSFLVNRIIAAFGITANTDGVDVETRCVYIRVAKFHAHSRRMRLRIVILHNYRRASEKKKREMRFLRSDNEKDPLLS